MINVQVQFKMLNMAFEPGGCGLQSHLVLFSPFLIYSAALLTLFPFLEVKLFSSSKLYFMGLPFYGVIPPPLYPCPSLLGASSSGSQLTCYFYREVFPDGPLQTSSLTRSGPL